MTRLAKLTRDFRWDCASNLPVAKLMAQRSQYWRWRCTLLSLEVMYVRKRSDSVRGVRIIVCVEREERIWNFASCSKK